MRQTASALPYPPTPNLQSRLRMEAMPAIEKHHSRGIVLRRVTFAAMALVLAGVLVMAVPPARAALLRWLRIGAVQITLPESTTTPTRTALPTGTATRVYTATPRPLSSVLDIGGETPLAAARRTVRFPIKLPAYPATLGPPDIVFVHDLGDQAVMLAWVDPASPRRVTLALQQLGLNAFAEKVQPRKVQDARVHGQPAVWAIGEHCRRPE